MPVPSRERVIELLADRPAVLGDPDPGYDVEDVTVSRAGVHSVVKVIVDRDSGFELDALADLSREISALLDSVPEFGETPYNLEVTTPGVDRPLTAPRHWRRARARWVSATVAGEPLEARVGALSEDESTVDLVLKSKTGPYVRTVSLADVTDAVVQVEFRVPSPPELELAGGVVPGRFDPANPPADPEPLDDDDSDEGNDK